MIASSGMPVLEQALDVGAGHVRHDRGAHLLLREVEDRLLARRQLDRALAQPTDRLRDRERARLRAARRVAVDADRGDEPDALLVAGAHLGSEHARRDHPDVAVGVEAVERERVPAREDREALRRALELEERDHVVGHEHADHVGVVRVGDLARLEAVVGRLLTRRVGAHAHLDVEARVAEVERPRAPLVAVADDRDRGALDGGEIGVVVVEDRRHAAHGTALGASRHTPRSTRRATGTRAW